MSNLLNALTGPSQSAFALLEPLHPFLQEMLKPCTLQARSGAAAAAGEQWPGDRKAISFGLLGSGLGCGVGLEALTISCGLIKAWFWIDLFTAGVRDLRIPEHKKAG